MITALYVDDEPSLLDIAKAFLERDGEISVETSSSAMDALVRIETKHFDAVICDYQMPVVDGIQFLKTLRLQGRDIPFILFTGRGREDVAIEALNNGADFYLQKGGDPKVQFTELVNMLERSIERRQSAERLKESEEIYEKLFKDNVEAMILVDPKTGAIADVNNAATAFYGYTREQMLRMNIADTYPQMSREDLVSNEHKDLEKGAKMILPSLLANGEVREIEVFSGTLRVKGRTMGYAIIHDITEMRQAQRREERLNRVFKVFSVTSQLILHARSEIALLDGASKALVENGGYLAAWIGSFDVGSGTAREIVRAERHDPGKAGQSFPIEGVMLSLLSSRVMGGQDIVVERPREGGAWSTDLARRGEVGYIALPLRVGKALSGILVIASDDPGTMEVKETILLSELADSLSEAISLVSERERKEETDEKGMRDSSSWQIAEERLWETGSKLRAIIQTSPMAIISMEPGGVIGTWNPAAEKVFGWEDVDTVRPFPFLPQEDTEAVKGLKARMTEGEALSDIEVSLKGLEGKQRSVSLSTAPILDQSGKVSSIIVVASDITERKGMEDRLLQLNDILRLVNRILRHDTLNELMVLSGSLDMYQKTKQERFLVTATKAVNRSMEMIKRMRELESLAASGGGMRPYDLRQTVENVLRGYMVEFSVEGEGSIYADDALPSAIDNIVRNAMIHGRADHIDARVWAEEGTVKLRIADNGTGIPDAVKKRIFEEGFSFGANAGTGLGLYLVTKAVERYRGKVSVEDNPPKGTAFVLTFPQA